MSKLIGALKKIEAHSECKLSYWRPQLSIQDIEQILQAFPFQLSSEVYDLYLWRNGTLPIPQEDEVTLECFNFGYHLADLCGDIELLPLEDAMFCWQTHDEWDASSLPYEPSNVFPLFSLYKGNIVVLGNIVQQDCSPVYWAEDLVVHIDQEPLYPNITNMMLAISEVIELGEQVWNSGICDRLTYEASCRVIDEKYGRSKSW